MAAEDVRIATNPPITIARLEARPDWTSLAAGDVEIDTLIVEDAVVPQSSVNAIGATLQKRAKATEPEKRARQRRSGIRSPRRVQLKKVTWSDGQQRMTVEAEFGLGRDGLLDVANFKVVDGRLAGASGTIKRNGDDWPVHVKVGGGTIAGKLQLDELPSGAVSLTGQLTTEGVEVAALTAPSKTLTGKLRAQTALRAEFRDIGQLGDVLATQTHFNVSDALVRGIDLARAVETAGLNRGGMTRLNALAGQVHTQGKTVHLTHLVATSGPLAANGNVTMAANRSLSGRINVDVPTAKGAVGVPLVVSGTADAPAVSMTRGALLGAVVGTVIAPGVGTSVGASAGERAADKLRGLFGK
ncbi:hypothetical protein FN976_12210 [Caenimonas sedimenti]|uniref:AsmA-like C-terminal domain-containing protein n=1 Tax=Caenimonas sedimenti TaxID=2596921 RepID=A0A562ZRQ9_9BURK|nr:hypothetical protein [Caenimonas sedimenti]TWO71077.1 hypothetical protein FN976_12210 [Caenimonas sedimenti]